MSRRTTGLVAATIAAAAFPFALFGSNGPTAAATTPHVSLAGASDTTAPYGPFGFTTKGLDKRFGGTYGSYGEPSLAYAPDGNHVVASTPGCAGNCYWYSADRGKTWKTSESTGFGGDSELDFLKDGTLISADLAIQNSVMHRSMDFGKTWTDETTAGGVQDRQWLGHSPDSTKNGGTLYLVYHDIVLEAEWIATSKDGGKSWTNNPAGTDAILVNSTDQLTATPAGVGCTEGNTSALVDQGVNTVSGPILVHPNGKDLYVIYSISDFQSDFDPTSGGVPPFGPVRAVIVAHSDDAGQSWTNRYVVCADPAVPTSNETTNGAIFPWGFMDSAGTVYVVFNSTRGQEGTGHFHQYYVYSKDKGATWSPPVRLDLGLAPNKGASLYATGAAVKPGVIDVAWYQTADGEPNNDDSTWVPYFAQVTKADTSKPTIIQQALTAIPSHKGGICLQGILCEDPAAPGSHDRSLADFFELAVHPQTGMAGIVYSDNNRLGLDGEDKIGEVVYAAQTKTPKNTVVKPPSSGNTGGNGSSSGTGGGGLATTGMAPLLSMVALVFLAASLAVRRRMRRAT